MKNLSSKQLKMIRNIIIVLGIAVGLLLWKLLPDTFRNTSVFHVGDGKTGFKYGALICLIFPFVSLLPGTNKEEFHGDDPEERKALVEEQEIKSAKVQVAYAIVMSVLVWILMGVAAIVL